jgi:hypothetical protein
MGTGQSQERQIQMIGMSWCGIHIVTNI